MFDELDNDYIEYCNDDNPWIEINNDDDIADFFKRYDFHDTYIESIIYSSGTMESGRNSIIADMDGLKCFLPKSEDFHCKGGQTVFSEMKCMTALLSSARTYLEKNVMTELLCGLIVGVLIHRKLISAMTVLHL